MKDAKRQACLPLNKQLIRHFLKIILVPILVLSLLLAGISLYSIAGNAAHACQSTNEQIVLNLQNTVDALTAMMNYAVLDEELLDILNKEYAQYGGGEFLERYQDQTRVTTSLLRIYHMNNTIHSVVIVPENTGTLYFGGLLPIEKSQRFRQESWYHTILAAKGRIIVTGAHPNSFSADGQPRCITIGRCIIAPMKQDKLLGVMMIHIPLDKLTALWTDGQPAQGSFTVIQDMEGNIIRQDAGMAAVSSAELARAAASRAKPGALNLLRAGGKQWLVIRSSSNLGWWVISCIPAGQLLYAGKSVLLAVGVLVLFLTVVLFFISRQIAGRITAPVEALNKTIHAFETGDFSARAAEGRDEIGILARSFNHMAAQIQRLICRIQEEEEEKRRHELLALQSQIQPHFLYNTLDSIKTVAALQGADQLARITESLVQFLRLCSRVDKDQILLSEELAMVERYIDIMNFRYFEAIRFRLSLPPACRHCLVPRFVLQPIVENALLHGFDIPQQRAGLLLRVFRRGGRLVVRVIDNGRGILPGKLAEINRGLREAEDTGGPIGLYNIHRRIRLLYGQGYGARVRSHAGRYTAVELLLPLRGMEGEDG